MSRSIVLVMDGLRANWLGPYGNTWFDTPVANQLATESIVYQNCLADAAELPALYRSFWLGERFDQKASRHLAQALSDCGVPTLLMSDAESMNALELCGEFDHHIKAPPPQSPGTSAVELADMATALTIGTAIEWLEDADDDFHCWIHAEGLAGMWDAPLAYREAMAEGEGIEVANWVAPPCETLSGRHDPDARLEWLLAAAAQVQALDELLAALLEFAEAKQSLLIVVGARGYPLGEHGIAGLSNPTLHTELLNLPLIVRYPDGRLACQRDHRLVQCSEVQRLVAAWHASHDEFHPSANAAQTIPNPATQLAVAKHEQQRGIRTTAWYARLSDEAVELYCKPDDQFEVNEIASRCVEEIEAIRRIDEQVSAGTMPPESERELPSVVWNPIR